MLYFKPETTPRFQWLAGVPRARTPGWIVGGGAPFKSPVSVASAFSEVGTCFRSCKIAICRVKKVGTVERKSW